MHDGYFKPLSARVICYVGKANRHITQINSTITSTDYIKPHLKENRITDNIIKRALIQGAGATLCFSLELLLMVQF